MGEQRNLLTVPEAAEMLHLAVITVRKMVSAKTIPHYKIGASVRLIREEILEWLEQKAVKPINSNLSRRTIR